MLNGVPSSTLSSNALRVPWVITLSMVVSLACYLGLAYFYGEHIRLNIHWAEHQRINLRTALYWIAILTLPLTNLTRHIQLRLNQTMPSPTSARNRYSVTVLVSMLLCESIGIYGFLLFCIGDGFNTLLIFVVISGLGLFLYRPKLAEYQSVVAALDNHP